MAIQHGHEAVTESNGTALLRCDLHCLHICVPSCRIILNRSTPCSVWRLGITLFYATARKICRRSIGTITFSTTTTFARSRKGRIAARVTTPQLAHARMPATQGIHPDLSYFQFINHNQNNIIMKKLNLFFMAMAMLLMARASRLAATMTTTTAAHPTSALRSMRG